MAEEKKLSGPDFAQGVSLSEFTDGGMLQGHAKGEPVLVARRGDSFFAIGASCTHYGAPLAEGLVVGDTVRSDARSGHHRARPREPRKRTRDGESYAGEFSPGRELREHCRIAEKEVHNVRICRAGNGQ
jgi:nitrite reductase/ring-hydroxylating ferredoxin subunit